MKQSIYASRIKAHAICLRIAARDGDALWVCKHQAAIHELTVRQQASALRRGRGTR